MAKAGRKIGSKVKNWKVEPLIPVQGWKKIGTAVSPDMYDFLQGMKQNGHKIAVVVDEALKDYKKNKVENHYTWLEQNLFPFLRKLGVSEDVISWNQGIISSHGDKCYGYRNYWKEKGVPFHHGVALYLLTYIHPWSEKVRATPAGWVDPWRWVIDNYQRYEMALMAVEG